jgi:hypothetical protein
MGAYRYERHAGRRTVGFAAFAAVCCLAWGLPASAQASTVPVIDSESVSHITSTDATIEAQINTGGRETIYEVWVGAYPECIEERVEACDSSSQHPIVGTIAAGSSSPASISVDVAKAWHALSPSSSYIYQVDATNSDWGFEGSAYGENKVFQTAATAPATSPPSIESESVSHLTPTDATLEAQINTEGLETTYEFELVHHLCPPGTEPLGCEAMIQRVPLPNGMLLGSFVGQSVSLDLNSAGVTLYPDAEYDYRVVVTSAAGKAEGSSHTFVTPEDAVQPLSTGTATSPPARGGRPAASTSGDQPAGSGGSSSSSTPGLKSLGPEVGKTTKLKALTNAQKLSKALKLCAKKPKKQLASCKKQAKKQYGTSGKKASRKRQTN